MFISFLRNCLSPTWLLENEVDTLTIEILKQRVEKNSKWLDVGCGMKPFQMCFDAANYVGIDIEVSGRPETMKCADKYFDGINIPYGDAEFDGILCTHVWEHAEELGSLLDECDRVIKKGGVFVVSVPFLFREHEQPFDFRRFTSYGVKKVFEDRGFVVEQSVKCLSSIETIATIFCVYINNNISSKSRFLHVILGLSVVLPSLLISKGLGKLLPDNRDVFCVALAVGKKI